MSTCAEMRYEFEEAFILDTSHFEQTFGMQATPLREAIQTTIAWFRKRGDAASVEQEKSKEAIPQR